MTDDLAGTSTTTMMMLQLTGHTSSVLIKLCARSQYAASYGRAGEACALEGPTLGSREWTSEWLVLASLIAVQVVVKMMVIVMVLVVGSIAAAGDGLPTDVVVDARVRHQARDLGHLRLDLQTRSVLS